ncbi:MAG: tetratricopeptide repeat protein [Treponema sp.]|nr:tetratricopeptide repeat protein [Treponema sp.]
MKRFFFIMAICLTGAFLFAQNNNFDLGESLFLQNKPEESLAYLEAAVTARDAPLQAYLYLGMAYRQLNRPDDAVAIYKKILPNAGDSTALVAYNLGNVYYSKGDFPSAEACYTQAIQEDDSFAPAYLNRANARLQNGSIDQAVADYAYYLTLDADTPQRTQIEAVLAAIQKAEDEAAVENQYKADKEAAILAKAQEQERQAMDSIPGIREALQTMEGIVLSIKTEEEVVADGGADNGGSTASAAESVAVPADTLEGLPPVNETESDISENSENSEDSEHKESLVKEE